MHILLFDIVAPFVVALMGPLGGSRVQRARALRAVSRGEVRGALRMCAVTRGRGRRARTVPGSWERGAARIDAQGLHLDGKQYALTAADLTGWAWPKGFHEDEEGGAHNEAFWFSLDVTAFRLQIPRCPWIGPSWIGRRTAREPSSSTCPPSSDLVVGVGEALAPEPPQVVRRRA